MEIEHIILEIKKRGLTGYKIAEDTGLSQVGIDKILNGTTKKPTKKTLEILNSYLNNSYTKQESQVDGIITDTKKGFNILDENVPETKKTADTDSFELIALREKNEALLKEIAFYRELLLKK